MIPFRCRDGEFCAKFDVGLGMNILCIDIRSYCAATHPRCLATLNLLYAEYTTKYKPNIPEKKFNILLLPLFSVFTKCESMMAK